MPARLPLPPLVSWWLQLGANCGAAPASGASAASGFYCSRPGVCMASVARLPRTVGSKQAAAAAHALSIALPLLLDELDVPTGNDGKPGACCVGTKRGKRTVGLEVHPLQGAQLSHAGASEMGIQGIT